MLPLQVELSSRSYLASTHIGSMVNFRSQLPFPKGLGGNPKHEQNHL